jgi:hypothetical protein
MRKTIPTYALYGVKAIPKDVIVGPNAVPVVERRAGRVAAAHQRACKQALNPWANTIRPGDTEHRAIVPISRFLAGVRTAIQFSPQLYRDLSIQLDRRR